jgi:hypothetical protein
LQTTDFRFYSTYFSEGSVFGLVYLIVWFILLEVREQNHSLLNIWLPSNIGGDLKVICICKTLDDWVKCLAISCKETHSNRKDMSFKLGIKKNLWHMSHTWEHNQDTIDTSLLCSAATNASSYLRSEINLASSFVGSSGASTWFA